MKRLLVAAKDKLKTMKKCDTIYHIGCQDCPETYVEETGKDT